MGLRIEIVPVTMYQQNCSLIWDDTSKQAAVVDPGGDVASIMACIEKYELKVEKILLTHAHFDHAGGAEELSYTIAKKAQMPDKDEQGRRSIPIIGSHQDDKFLCDTLDEQLAQVGFKPAPPFTPDEWLNEGDKVSIGSEVLDVYHTPGHTPGHIIFFYPPLKLAWVGDVLFKGSIGRTDFPRGDLNALTASIKNKLWPLGNDVTFIPGHGPHSTFGEERRTNPYVADEMPIY